MKRAVLIRGRDPLDQDIVIQNRRRAGNQYTWPVDNYERLAVPASYVDWIDGLGLVEIYERGFCRIDGRTARFVEFSGLPHFKAKGLAPEIYNQLLRQGRRNKAAALAAKYRLSIQEHIPEGYPERFAGEELLEFYERPQETAVRHAEPAFASG